jgi:Zn-dependent protease
MWLSDLTLQSIGFRILALPIIVGIQGGIVASAAVLFGDNGPKYDGRLTIVPTSHIDFTGTISLIFFGLGWAKPIDIDVKKFCFCGIGIVVTISAGFFSLLATAILLNELVLAALTTLPFTVGLGAAAFLRNASSLSIWVALLSLFPISPLTGGLLLNTIGIRIPQQQTRRILAAALLVAVSTGVVHQLLDPAYSVLESLIIGK